MRESQHWPNTSYSCTSEPCAIQHPALLSIFAPLGTGEVRRAVCSIFTLSGLKTAPNFQAVGVTYVIIGKSNSCTSFLLLTCKMCRESGRENCKKKQAGVIESYRDVSLSTEILVPWVNISVFKLHVVLLVSTQQGCRMLLDLHHSLW